MYSATDRKTMNSTNRASGDFSDGDEVIIDSPYNSLMGTHGI